MAAAHPLACGNGLSLLDSMEKAIHTVAWLKRKLNPFDVINVSITAFAHKISMEITEKGVILCRKHLEKMYGTLFLPEYQCGVTEQLWNCMIFHWAQQLKLLCYINMKWLWLDISYVLMNSLCNLLLKLVETLPLQLLLEVLQKVYDQSLSMGRFGDLIIIFKRCMRGSTCYKGKVFVSKLQTGTSVMEVLLQHLRIIN